MSPHWICLTAGTMILSAALVGQEPDGFDNLSAVREFEAALNNLVQAGAQVPEANVQAFDHRARIAVGAAVSSYCRFPLAPPLQLRELSDANVVEFVLSTFIGDLEGILNSASPDSVRNLVRLRLRQAIRLYPICEQLDNVELLYMTQIFALASVGGPEALREELVSEAGIRGRDGKNWELLPWAAAFSALDWSPPDSLHLTEYRDSPMFRMLQRQFLATRSSALKAVKQRVVDDAGDSGLNEEQ